MKLMDFETRKDDLRQAALGEIQMIGNGKNASYISKLKCSRLTVLVGVRIRALLLDLMGFKVGQNWYGVLYQTLARPDLKFFRVWTWQGCGLETNPRQQQQHILIDEFRLDF